MDTLERSEQEAEYTLPRHHRHSHLEPFRDTGKLFWLRQWLNVLFMIGAVLGIVMLYVHSRELGIYIFIGASVLKFVELSLRILKL